MATYIKGVTDYIPQIQPFRPDFNFYQNVLARKQQQYDQGWSKVNSLYNSLLNAPMTNPQNVATRDDFFKRAEFEIKRLSGVDLSNPTNIDAAYKLFKPYYSDENIIHDMSNTKRAMNNYQKGNTLRYETDAKKGAGTFWQEGLDYIDLWRKRYSEASLEDALNMSAPSYVPFFDIRTNMMDDIKENKFEMIRESAPGGKIKMKYKNGTMMIPSLSTYYEGFYANNPQAQAMYKVKAELDQYGWMEKNKSNYDSDDAAENAYISETLNSVIKSQNNLRDDIQSDTESVEYMSKVYDEYTEKYGGRSYITEIQGQLSSQKDSLKNTKQSLDAVNLVLNNGEKMDISKYKGRSAQLKSTLLMRQDILHAAEHYATLTSEETWEYDDKWLLDYKSGLAIDEYKAKALIDIQLAEMEATKARQGDVFQNIMLAGIDLFSANVDPTRTVNKNLERIKQAEDQQYKLEEKGAYSILRAGLVDAARSDANVNLTALTALTNNLLKGLFTEKKGDDGQLLNPEDVGNRSKERELKKKLKAIQIGLQEKSNNNSLTPNDIDQALKQYDKLLSPHMHITDVYGMTLNVKDGGKMQGAQWFNLLADDDSPLKNWYKENYSINNQVKYAKESRNLMVDQHRQTLNDAYVKLDSRADVSEEDKELLDYASNFDHEGNKSPYFSKGQFPTQEQFISAYLRDNEYEERSMMPMSVIGRNLGYAKDAIDFTLRVGDDAENLMGAAGMMSDDAAKISWSLAKRAEAKEKYNKLHDLLETEYQQIGTQFGYDSPGSGTYMKSLEFGKVDAISTGSKAYETFMDLSMDIRTKLDDSSVVVRTGSPGTYDEDGNLPGQPISKSVVEQLMTQVFDPSLYMTNKDGSPKDRKNPYLTFSFHGGALNDPDKVAIHIKPNPYWISDFVSGSKDSNAGPGSTAAFYNSPLWESQAGVTVYMNKSDLRHSDLSKTQQVSDIDMILQSGQKVEINNFPSAGYVSFQKGSLIQTNSGLSFADQGMDIIASYQFKGYTFSDGKLIEKDPITEYVNIGPYTGIDSETAVSEASGYLFQLSQNNINLKNIQTALENKKITINQAKKMLGLQPNYSDQMKGLEQNSYRESNQAENFLLGGLK